MIIPTVPASLWEIQPATVIGAGFVGMKNIDEIIESLLSHEISKRKAIKEIRKIIDGLTSSGMIEMKAGDMAYNIDNKDACIQLSIKDGYDKIKHINTDDKVLIIKKP